MFSPPLPSPPTSPTAPAPRATATAAATRIRAKAPRPLSLGNISFTHADRPKNMSPSLSAFLATTADPDTPASEHRPIAPPFAGKRRKPSIAYYTPSSPAPWSQHHPQPSKTMWSADDGALVVANANASRRSSLALGLRSPSESVFSADREPLTLVERHADLLHFIAQKERKCLELRDQLATHEKELGELKHKWERIVHHGRVALASPPSTAGRGRAPKREPESGDKNNASKRKSRETDHTAGRTGTEHPSTTGPMCSIGENARPLGGALEGSESKKLATGPLPLSQAGILSAQTHDRVLAPSLAQNCKPARLDVGKSVALTPTLVSPLSARSSPKTPVQGSTLERPGWQDRSVRRGG